LADNFFSLRWGTFLIKNIFLYDCQIFDQRTNAGKTSQEAEILLGEPKNNHLSGEGPRILKEKQE
jgi:hypothetical protein